MRIGKTKLRMSDGSIRYFKSSAALERFEKFAKAYKGGWRPRKRIKKL